MLIAIPACPRLDGVNDNAEGWDAGDRAIGIATLFGGLVLGWPLLMPNAAFIASTCVCSGKCQWKARHMGEFRLPCQTLK